MLTFFTTAKPFYGHDGIIQRNALKSWTLLHPDVEVILFGDEDGAAEVCADLRIRHERHVERYESKFPYVNFMFARAQEITRHQFVCYSNCDIVLFSDFWKAFERARAWRKRFLLVGQRWDADITQPVNFDDQNWASNLRQLAVMHGVHQYPDFVDFFLFRNGLYDQIPPLVVGYSYWDHWMVWKALSVEAPVLDASPFIVPVHQNHGYRTTPERFKGSHADRIAMRNFKLSGNGKQLRSIADATYVLGPERIKRNTKRHWMRFSRTAPSLAHFLQFKLWKPTFFCFLGITRPLRTALGLRTDPLRRLREKI